IRASRPSDPNRIFVIVGEPGAGKSHLARWIEYTLESSPTHLGIHIPRHIDTLQAVLERLAERTGVAAPVKPAAHVADVPADTLVQYLTASIAMELGAGTPAGQRDPALAA